MAARLCTSMLLLMYILDLMSMVLAETCGPEKEQCKHGCCVFYTRCCTELEWRLWIHGIIPLGVLGVVVVILLVCVIMAFITPAPHGQFRAFARFVKEGPPQPKHTGTKDYW
ncbi:uncharacterized protein LOC125380921 [Haliotis rufescens]|uniref:uncharacterized protein LOC125380921 n=1 Tax=Haliotis rufescens TaxID=6454 RepID=UPI00201F8DB5|nr:uncharacterized protein LOC125380921 [Haliotis rufescens]